ncbi:MAG: hypothetical protein BJ554DRAFT_5520 [Olpidium bornovanus]|uniref:Oxidoreductase-like domain-containing protein n=1 Tax=Olpidium bornovanus TaxID=278681 RepID=A0A8H7ZZQ8_9FUNG|nr:MAG: hypothetical protein BJ554DRAFT_5520 [Olpidium bornovanus]
MPPAARLPRCAVLSATRAVSSCAPAALLFPPRTSAAEAAGPRQSRAAGLASARSAAVVCAVRTSSKNGRSFAAALLPCRAPSPTAVAARMLAAPSGKVRSVHSDGAGRATPPHSRLWKQNFWPGNVQLPDREPGWPRRLPFRYTFFALKGESQTPQDYSHTADEGAAERTRPPVRYGTFEDEKPAVNYDENGKVIIPPKPSPPEPDECCGAGCAYCSVWDEYDEKLANYRAAVEAASEAHGPSDPGGPGGSEDLPDVDPGMKAFLELERRLKMK